MNALELIEKEKKEKTGKLDIGNCGLTELPKELFELHWLEELIVSNEYKGFKTDRFTSSNNQGIPNQIQEIPSQIRFLKNLKTLVLEGHFMEDWQIKGTVYLSNLKQLQFLNLDYNGISNIRFLQNLKDLKVLKLVKNKISDISFLQDLKQLKALNLSANKISDISFLQDLKQLKTLSLSNNEISDISFIQNLKQLEYLNLSYNQISNIGHLKDLKQLESLNLMHNKILDISPLLLLLKKDISLSIGLNRFKKGINLRRNPLKTPPIEIVKKGRKAVLSYFKAIEKSEDIPDKKNAKINEVKLVFIGNSTAGKTTLAKFLKTGKVSKNHTTTHGIQRWIWKPEKGYISGVDNLQIQMFDFGGQEYYHDTHHLFFTRDTAYILVWEEKTNCFGTQNTLIKTKNEKNVTEEVEVAMDFFPLTYWLDTIDYFTRKTNNQKTEYITDKYLKKNIQIKETSDLKIIAGDYWDIIRDYREFFKPQDKAIYDEHTVFLSYGKSNIYKKPSKYQQQTYTQTPVLILQNKTKLKNKDNKETGTVFINNKELQDKYPFIYDISAVSLHENYRTQNVKDLVQEAIAQMEIVGKSYPSYLYKIKEEKIDNANFTTKPYQFINEMVKEWIDFAKTELGINATKEEIKVLLLMLKSSGVIHYFKEDISVAINASAIKKQKENADPETIVFFDYQWILEQIYKILNTKLSKNKGVFSQKEMLHALGKKRMDSDAIILMKLMKKFHLIFDHPQIEEANKKDPKYVAPQYLPATADTNVSFFLKKFSYTLFKYQFKGFIHKSIILQFYSEYGKDVHRVKGQNEELQFYYWRNGIVIEKNNDYVYIWFSQNNSEIDISADKAKITPLMEEIVATLDRITKTYKPEKMVSVDGKEYIPMEKLLQSNQPVFVHDKKAYQLGDYKIFLKDKKGLFMKKVFISYSSKDFEFMKRFEVHLAMLKRNNYISVWHDRKLFVGEEWDKKIKEELENADIIFFLLSPDFLNTDYIWDIEIEKAIKRYEDPNDRVIIAPILLKNCMWKDTPISKFNVPLKAEPVGDPDNDDLWYAISEEIKKQIKEKG